MLWISYTTFAYSYLTASAKSIRDTEKLNQESDESLNTKKLLENMTDQIMEAQIKLGYARETVRLYYPAVSLNALLGTGAKDAEELRILLEEAPDLKNTPLGKLTFRAYGGRMEISVPPEGTEYVHREIGRPAFLTELITLFRTHHACSLEQIRGVFEKYSREYVCEKMPEGADFDYVLHFEDAAIDPYYYCVKEEMGHTIYHRFIKEDYEALLDA